MPLSFRSAGLPVALSLAVAATLAWLVYRHETARYSATTECSRALAATFDREAATMSDSLVFDHLLAHRDRCIGDAAYVDQARRLMTNVQRASDARALLADADRHHAFTPDELAAQLASVDVAEARVLVNDGEMARARALHQRAVATAQRLRERWPEWSMPYRLLDDANGTAEMLGDRPSTGAVPMEYFALEQAAQSRVLSGAFVRSLGEGAATAFAFVIAALGMLGLFVAVDGMRSAREMMRLPTSSIASATPGYVELKGTLHLLPNADVMIGPSTGSAGVWYELETNSGEKGAKTWRERSAQRFVLRDASGEAVIDPKDMTVSTRHSVTSFTSSGGLSTRKRVSERMLKEGDDAYVLGELSVASEIASEATRHVHVASDGRQLLVSNLSEAELNRRERLWLWSGVVLFALCATVLLWGWYQRYRVLAVPGVII